MARRFHVPVVERTTAASHSVFKACMGLAVCLLTGGCTPSMQAGPARLFPVSAETAAIRGQVGVPDLKYYLALSESERTRYRNSIVLARMYAIDLAYSEYEASLTQEEQQSGFVATAGQMGLTTASSLVTPPGTKSILAGVATAVTGTKAAYDDQILAKKTIPVLQGQMRANRARIAAQIILRLKVPDSNYPLALALSDVEAYYQAGTITGGLVGVSATVSQDLAAADSEKSSAIEITLATDSASSALRAYLYPNGAYDKARAAILRQKLAILAESDPLARDPLAVVIRDAGHASVRIALARQIGLVP